MEESQEPEVRASQRRDLLLLQWMKGHKLRTFLGIAGLVAGMEIATLPFGAVANLRTANPAETALMRQRKEEAATAGVPFTIHATWIPLSRIPRHLINAVIVAEDGTFYRHSGIEWYEVWESLQKDIRTGRFARGASTITQQLAKNLFLSTSKDPIRKLKEVAIAYLLEYNLSKERILELYLNEIEWGKGIFGVEAAARAYFGKSAAYLTVNESARLAAVIPSPRRHRPDDDSRYVLRRKAIVLNRMAERNFLPPRRTPDSTLAPQSPEPLPEVSFPDDSLTSDDSTLVEEDDNEL
jgi:monofunctional biosynthetic peptidoglycan transglycosylase